MGPSLDTPRWMCSEELTSGDLRVNNVMGCQVEEGVNDDHTVSGAMCQHGHRVPSGSTAAWSVQEPR
jgi:hypothetical protein